MTLRTAERTYTFWAPICYETCYAGIAREAARAGAQFFVNITSEGWAGWGFCRNQIAVSALRAVENRVGVVRVGNTGISCFIRPDGRIEKVLHGLDHGSPLLEPGVLIHRVRVDPHEPTLYARFGDALDLVWPGLWSALFLLGVVGRARRRGSVPAHRDRVPGDEGTGIPFGGAEAAGAEGGTARCAPRRSSWAHNRCTVSGLTPVQQPGPSLGRRS